MKKLNNILHKMISILPNTPQNVKIETDVQLLTSTLLINSLLQLQFELYQCRSQMAKKRSRRVGPSSSHRSERVESSSQNHQTHRSVKSHTNQHRWLTTFCILFVAIILLIYRQNYYSLHFNLCQTHLTKFKK